MMCNCYLYCFIFLIPSVILSLFTPYPPPNQMGLGLLDTYSGIWPGLSIFSLYSLFPPRLYCSIFLIPSVILSLFTPYPPNQMGLGLLDTYSGIWPGLSIYSFHSLFPPCQLSFNHISFILHQTLFHKTVIDFQLIPISIPRWTHDCLLLSPAHLHWLLLHHKNELKGKVTFY